MDLDLPARRRTALHTQILVGLVAGAAAGVLANALWRDAPVLLWAVDNVAQPIGQVFLRMLFMVVVPLVFTSLALGVANIGDLGRLGGSARKHWASFWRPPRWRRLWD